MRLRSDIQGREQLALLKLQLNELVLQLPHLRNLYFGFCTDTLWFWEDLVPLSVTRVLRRYRHLGMHSFLRRSQLYRRERLPILDSFVIGLEGRYVEVEFGLPESAFKPLYTVWIEHGVPFQSHAIYDATGGNHPHGSHHLWDRIWRSVKGFSTSDCGWLSLETFNMQACITPYHCRSNYGYWISPTCSDIPIGPLKDTVYASLQHCQDVDAYKGAWDNPKLSIPEIQAALFPRSVADYFQSDLDTRTGLLSLVDSTTKFL